MMTKIKSYPQLLFARATDRQRSFLRRSAWMLGYILLGIAGILCAMLWGLVKEVFKELGKTRLPEKSEEPLLYDFTEDEYLDLHDYRREDEWNKIIPRDL